MKKPTGKIVRPSHYHRDGCREAANVMMVDMDWEATPQGADYWSNIYEQLEALANLKEFTVGESKTAPKPKPKKRKRALEI